MKKKIALIASLIFIIVISIIIITNPTEAFINLDDIPRNSIETEFDYAGRDIINVAENMFITQINDINANRNVFEGKLVRIEGFIYTFADIEGNVHTSVARNVPACCQPEEFKGFVFYYDGEIPRENEWVEIIGTLEIKNLITSREDVVIQVERLTIKEERGLSFVTR